MRGKPIPTAPVSNHRVSWLCISRPLLSVLVSLITVISADMTAALQDDAPLNTHDCSLLGVAQQWNCACFALCLSSSARIRRGALSTCKADSHSLPRRRHIHYSTASASSYEHCKTMQGDDVGGWEIANYHSRTIERVANLVLTFNFKLILIKVCIN